MFDTEATTATNPRFGSVPNGFCTNSFETFELAHETEERRDAGFVSEKSGAIVPNATVATAQIFAVVFEIKLQR